MGFTVKRRIYKLVFQGDFAGMNVVVRGLNLGQLLKLTAARETREAGGEGVEEATDRMIDLLLGALVSWDAEDEDTGLPIPRTEEAIKLQDPDFYMTIIDVWHKAMNGVPAPLSQTSTGGVPSVEASIPMDVPSESLAS